MKKTHAKQLLNGKNKIHNQNESCIFLLDVFYINSLSKSVNHRNITSICMRGSGKHIDRSPDHLKKD